MIEQGKHRKHSRIKKLLVVEMTPYGPDSESGIPSLGRTINISKGGVLMEVAKGMPFQIVVNVSLGFENEVLNMQAEMVHLRKTDEGAMEVGIEFINPTDEQLELLDQAMISSLGQVFT